MDDESSIRVRAGKSLLLEKHHGLIDSFARGTDQVGQIALSQYNSDLYSVTYFTAIAFCKCQQLTRNSSIYIQSCKGLNHLI